MKRPDNVLLTFGMHLNRPLWEVPTGYLVWALGRANFRLAWPLWGERFARELVYRANADADATLADLMAPPPPKRPETAEERAARLEIQREKERQKWQRRKERINAARREKYAAKTAPASADDSARKGEALRLLRQRRPDMFDGSDLV